MAKSMKATIFVEPGRIELTQRPIPDIGPLDALVRVTTTTICGTDVHIMKGEYPVRKGLSDEEVLMCPDIMSTGFGGAQSGGVRIGDVVAVFAQRPIITTLCPGGKERMRRLMDVIASGRTDLKPLVTHRFKLDDIEAAYELFSHQRDGVLKVAITP